MSEFAEIMIFCALYSGLVIYTLLLSIESLNPSLVPKNAQVSLNPRKSKNF